MAEILSQFEKINSGSVTFAGTEYWVELSNYGPDIYTVVPLNKRLWSCFVTCISWDKEATFEFRPNLQTKSAPTVADTGLRGMVKVPAGDSKELDVFYNKNILTEIPLGGLGTGVEKLWLRIKTNSNSAGTYDFIHYFTEN